MQKPDGNTLTICVAVVLVFGLMVSCQIHAQNRGSAYLVTLSSKY